MKYANAEIDVAELTSGGLRTAFHSSEYAILALESTKVRTSNQHPTQSASQESGLNSNPFPRQIDVKKGLTSV